MKGFDKIDGFLSAALWITGAGAVWAIVYFGASTAFNTLMVAFPVMLVTVVLAAALFVSAFCIMRGFPLSGVTAEERASDRWTEEKKQAFADGFPRRQKLCRRLTYISFGMLIPVAVDLVLLYLI